MLCFKVIAATEPIWVPNCGEASVGAPPISREIQIQRLNFVCKVRALQSDVTSGEIASIIILCSHHVDYTCNFTPILFSVLLWLCTVFCVRSHHRASISFLAELVNFDKLTHIDCLLDRQDDNITLSWHSHKWNTCTLSMSQEMP